MLQLTSNYFSQLLDYEEDGEFHLKGNSGVKMNFFHVKGKVFSR